MTSTAHGVVVDIGSRGPASDAPPDLVGLLASEGDARLALSESARLNKYGCSVLPRPAALSFSSSTASSISPRALARAEIAVSSWHRVSRMRGGEFALDRKVEDLREELSDLLGLSASGVDIVFSPSGTDSQLHALALIRAWLGAPLVSIVVAADETGSGTAFTASGRHFGALTAHGRPVLQAGSLDGMDGILDAVRIPIHGPNGPRSLGEIDDAVLAAVAQAARAGQKIVIQAMNGSKLGRRCPSDDCLDEIRRRWRGTAQIVVDACQMRLSRGRLRHHLGQGDMVLLTGSKFFTGPAFSGALLVPSRLCRIPVADLNPPPGLADYSSRHEWPPRYKLFREILPCRVALGSWLRWEAVMAEMTAYFAVPLRFRHQALEFFAGAARECLSEGARHPVRGLRGQEIDEIDGEFVTPTIFPFLLKSGGGWASPERVASLYRAMNEDVGATLPAGADKAARAAAARLCHIGQPVAMMTDEGPTAALRVSADARFITDCWSPEPTRARRLLGDHIENLRHTFDKLERLL